jgi:HEPN domain-containing protein
MKEATEPWITKAEEDLKAAMILFESGDFPSAVVCFHAQQVVEKYLKAYLTENSIEFRRTHDLIVLLDEYCLYLDRKFDDFRDQLKEFAYYAIDARYPGADIPPSISETKQALAVAKKFKEFVLDRIT